VGHQHIDVCLLDFSMLISSPCSCTRRPHIHTQKTGPLAACQCHCQYCT
jgi:hypothetical protein